MPSVRALESPMINNVFPLSPQVNEIYHDESLGVHINVVLVRMIMLGYAKVRLHNKASALFLKYRKLQKMVETQRGVFSPQSAIHECVGEDCNAGERQKNATPCCSESLITSH